VAHVGLTVDAPIPEMLKFKAKYYQAYGSISDHKTASRATPACTCSKPTIEKAGKIDPKAVAQALHGLNISAKKIARRHHGREL
jgi:branched-chain amino acid transport system substrate-binding protein